MSVYAQLKGEDYIRYLQSAIDSGQLKWSNDYPDKLEPMTRGLLENPWVVILMGKEHHTQCAFSHKILFNLVSLHFTPRFVPSYCQECWKIVARPQTLRQLWDICDLQTSQQLPSKAGIEERREVFGLYGAYWYTRSMEEGRALYQSLSGQIGVPLILKRGCTEMEMNCGDSSKWQVYDGQLEVEERFRNLIVIEKYTPILQTDWVISNIKRRWIEWAWEHGDKTVYEFTDGKPLVPAYKTYHE